MRSSVSFHIAATWLLAAVLCTGCAHHPLPPSVAIKGNVEAMREAVATEVHDPQRAARLNRAIDGLREQLLGFEQKIAMLRVDAQALNAKPDATRAEFEGLLNEFDNKRAATRTRVIELHFELIAATTPNEWAGLAGFEHAMLVAAER